MQLRLMAFTFKCFHPLPPPHTQAHMRTRTHMLTRVRTYNSLCMRTHTHSCMHTHAHTFCTNAPHKHTFTPILHTQTHTHHHHHHHHDTHMHAQARAYTRACSAITVLARTHALVCTHANTWKARCTNMPSLRQHQQLNGSLMTSEGRADGFVCNCVMCMGVHHHSSTFVL